MAKSHYSGQRARTDSNHSQIIKDLRKLHSVTVKSVASIKKFCDIIVGYKDRNYLIEIKDGEKPPSQRKLTPDEKEFHDEWTGQINIALNINDILNIIDYKE